MTKKSFFHIVGLAATMSWLKILNIGFSVEWVCWMFISYSFLGLIYSWCKDDPKNDERDIYKNLN